MSYLGDKKLIFAPSVVVQEGGSGGKLKDITISENGQYYASDDGVYGYNWVTVTVPTYEEEMNKTLDRNISSLSLPTIKSIGRYALAYTHLLETIDAPEVTTIEPSAFLSSGLINANFPKLVTIESATTSALGTFANCPMLEQIDLPSVENIGNFAFFNAIKLKKVTIGTPATIGTNAFAKCGALDTLVIDTAKGVPTLTHTNAFALTPIASGTGYIFTDNINELKVAENWSTYAEQIKAKTDVVILTDLPDKVKMNNGEPVTLSIETLTIDGTPFYQWYKNGIAIKGATAATYETAETGEYKVLVNYQHNGIGITLQSSECQVYTTASS